MANKAIYTALYALVNALADNYGFDSDEGMEVVESWTDVNHIEVITALLEKAPKKPKEDKPKKEETKKEEKPKKEDKPKKEETKKEEKEKRIKRMSPTLAGQLKTALGNVGIDVTDANKKGLDKLKKDFVDFIEKLDDETWRASGLVDHMRHFAASKAPKPTVEATKEPEKVPVIEKVTETREVTDMTLDELKEIGLLTPIDTPGVFWDGDNGQFVTGPAEEDEDFDEVTFEGKKYAIGEKTNRVYEARDDKDIFVGFKGIGKFKSLTV